MSVVKELSLADIKDHKMKSFINSACVYGKDVPDHMKKVLGLEQLPAIELGKVYYTEEQGYNSKGQRITEVWIGLVIKLGKNEVVWKVLATSNYDFSRESKTGCADIKIDTWFTVSRAMNLHEIVLEDLPLYIGLSYVSGMFSQALKNGVFPWQES